MFVALALIRKSPPKLFVNLLLVKSNKTVKGDSAGLFGLLSKALGVITTPFCVSREQINVSKILIINNYSPKRKYLLITGVDSSVLNPNSSL